MPATHLALLRGINVGRAKRVAMADLRAVAAGLGWEDPRTVLASGNLLFGAPGLDPREAAERLEGAMRVRLGLVSRVLVLTAAEVTAVLDADPLVGVAGEPSRHLVTLFHVPDEAATRLAPLAARDWGADRLAVGPRAAYLWCPDGILGNPLPEAVGRALGDACTTRNRATMERLRPPADPCGAS